MNKTLGAVGLLLLATAGSALASGYRIPEQSVNSTARAGSYVAYTPSADAAYYNPANMSWLEDRGYLEVDATWIHLSAIEYTDHIAARSGETEEEDFFLPTFFAVSPDYNNFRVGFSVTAPGGLSKRWQDPYPRTFAEEFSLKIFDVNPTLSYKFCDRFSVAGGVRAIYVDGKVKSNGVINAYGTTATRDMDGDALEAGYNLAMTVRPVDKMNVSVTYRSEVDLGIEGHANLSTNYPVAPNTYSGDTGVEIPLPAVLAVAASYTFFDQLTVELEYDRTYWSDYEQLDFTYPAPFSNPALDAAFDDAKAKKWSDTDAWRLSFTYDLKNNFTLMAGIAIDENPVPNDNLGFELPDSDAMLYSVGLRYKVNQDMELGVAYLYDDKESRDVNNASIDGSFEDAAAHLLTFGLTYKL
ncbi:OmpP1/FadL family transporter [Desulfobulbus sp.]|uniref:OmpP1/FadL family transporter n=1 Tax=Desulfobulbus sp. TaxID=895 RepID=UPI0027BA4EC5|nr:porin [Desulfobulbus sp.]